MGALPDHPHKNIACLLKGKCFRKPDISETIQELLKNKKEADRVALYHAAASDQVGNITMHKVIGRLDNSAISATGAKLAFKSNEEIAVEVATIPLDEVIPDAERVLLINIEVQGWEYHILRGASKLLSWRRDESPYLIYEENDRLLQASNSSSEKLCFDTSKLRRLIYERRTVNQDANRSKKANFCPFLRQQDRGIDISYI